MNIMAVSCEYMYMCNGNNSDMQYDLKMRLAISLGRLPECMTSLFRELVSVPIAVACSRRMTFCPSIASALHTASPTTPAKQVEQLSVQVLMQDRKRNHPHQDCARKHACAASTVSGRVPAPITTASKLRGPFVRTSVRCRILLSG